MTTSNLSIFIQDYAPRTTRIVQTPDGTASVYSALAIGRIAGKSRTIPALVCEEISEDDRWYLVNLMASGGYLDTVAVLGATSGNQAEEWARRQVLTYLAMGDSNAYASCIGDDATASADALQEYLDSAAAGVCRLPIRRKDIEAFEGKITDRPVVWDQEWLKSHTAADLLHELARRDQDAQLMDAMMPNELPKLIEQEGGEQAEYDAIIVDYNRLELLQERLMSAMAKAAIGNVRPVNVTQTKPFKRNGVTNVAVLYELSDGQSVTIVFHSPDATPAKLGPKDTLTSWKFMLNKRDVTAAVAPENGENVQLPALAKRILLLVEKNSARFKRANGKKAEQMQQLADTNTRIEQKTATLNGLNDEIEALQKAVDAGVSAPAGSDDRNDAIDELAEIEMLRAVQSGSADDVAAVLEKAKSYGLDAVKKCLNTVSIHNLPMMTDLAGRYGIVVKSSRGMTIVPTVAELAAAVMAGKGSSPSVPASVELRISAAVQNLQAKAKSLDQAIKVRGHGANLEQALAELQPEIDSSMAVIRQIRNAASKNDASDEVERLIAAAGGIPDFTQYQLPPDNGISKDGNDAIDNMLLALQDDQELKGRIEQAVARMNIADISGDMVENWYKANSRTYLSGLPTSQMMKAAAEFKRLAVETVNRIGRVLGMSDNDLYRLAMYLGYSEKLARNPGAVAKKALAEHRDDLDKAFAKFGEPSSLSVAGKASAEAAATGIQNAANNERPKNWRTDRDAAASVASGMGIDTKGMQLKKIVTAIETKDRESRVDAAADLIDDVLADVKAPEGFGIVFDKMREIKDAYNGAGTLSGYIILQDVSGIAKDDLSEVEVRIAVSRVGESESATGYIFEMTGPNRGFPSNPSGSNGAFTAEDSSIEGLRSMFADRLQKVFAFYANKSNATPTKNRTLDQKIKLVADSVEKVRPQDVQRLLASIEGNTRVSRNDARQQMADYLKAFRPDLAEEVESVLFDLQEDLEVEPDDLARFGQVEITSQGSENIYFTKDGQKYFSKVMNTEQYPVGPFDLGANPNGLPKATPTANPDADFLNAVIAGTPSDMPPKEITAKLKSIYMAAKDSGNADMLALGDKAIRAYAAQTKAKAQAKLAEVQ